MIPPEVNHGRLFFYSYPIGGYGNGDFCMWPFAVSPLKMVTVDGAGIVLKKDTGKYISLAKNDKFENSPLFPWLNPRFY